ncbi:MAG: ArsC family transcriptional regulator [Clostridia bacterium]|nr:ArsC family transcriptional regulator [Clostridia bacterium]
MALQIFCGKGFDTQKAERFFKERRIPYQKIDTLKYGISRRELESVIRAVGLKNMCDQDSKAYKESVIAYTQNQDTILEGLMEHPALMRLPIVRAGKNATVGYAPDVWETWIKDKLI